MNPHSDPTCPACDTTARSHARHTVRQAPLPLRERSNAWRWNHEHNERGSEYRTEWLCTRGGIAVRVPVGASSDTTHAYQRSGCARCGKCDWPKVGRESGVKL